MREKAASPNSEGKVTDAKDYGSIAISCFKAVTVDKYLIYLMDICISFHCTQDS